MLCWCGCGRPATTDAGFNRTGCYSRYRRNGGRSVPMQPRTRCKPLATVAEGNPLTPGDIRLLARTLAARDPYPLETTSADVTLSSPCTPEDDYRLRQRERGLVQVECGGCGGVAWQEPVVFVNGVATTVVRCRACASRRKCVGCGERPPRYRRDLCTECVREKREETQTMAATAEKTAQNGKATKTCPYCKKPFEGRAKTQITCGSDECKRKHMNWLSANPRHKQAEEKPPAVDPAVVLERAKSDMERWEEEEAARVDQDGPVLCGSPDNAGLPVAMPPQQHNPAIYEGVKAANPDPILAAVLALEAVPFDKHCGVLELVSKRAAVRRAEQEAESLLASLRGCKP